MNCQQFSQIVRELARHQLYGLPLAADARAQAFAHADVCARCQALLEDEAKLSAGLRALASSEDALRASDKVETALLAAFRQAQTQPAVLPLRHWAWAAAAALLLFAGLLAARQSNGPAVEVVTSSPTPTPIVAPPSLFATTASASVEKPMPMRKRFAKRAARPRYQIERMLVESEIATDFLPLSDLTGSEVLPKPESLQVIRVELPRTALASFGLPMSFERAAEPVKADLVVGSDGLTRAIRFVQTGINQAQIISANNPPSKER
jgi:hypothetical protein